MRPDGPVADLTPAQMKQAKIAGIPSDRPGLGAEYPKMVYRPGKNERHQILGGKEGLLPISNGPLSRDGQKLAPGFECETAFVDSAEDEAQAIADGWFLSPDPEQQKAEVEKRKAENAKDDEIARLKAELAAKDAKPKAA